MNNDSKRFLQFIILSFLLVMGMNLILAQFGLLPEPPPAAEKKAEAEGPEAGGDSEAGGGRDAAVVEAEAEAEAGNEDDEPAGEGGEEVAEAEAKIEAEPEPEPEPVEAVDPSLLVLGPESADTPEGYKLRVQLAQDGAGVETIQRTDYLAEFVGNKPADDPLLLVQARPDAPPPLALQALAEVEDEIGRFLPFGGLDRRRWEVVRPAAPVEDEDGEVIGREVAFRTTLRRPGGAPPVELTKTFRLLKGRDMVDLTLEFRLPDDTPEAAATVPLHYRLIGPYNLPIEGEWYTYTFRDAYFGKDAGEGSITVETHSAYDIVNAGDDPYRSTALPTVFAGVENQYFAAFIAPQKVGNIAEATMTVVEEDPADGQKSDVVVNLISEPVGVGLDDPKTHRFEVFAGPKTPEALPDYADELFKYRKGFWLWRVTVGGLAAGLASGVIAPMLGFYYSVTDWVAGLFGGTRGSYGIAILFLTVTVRLLMFPLSRKQAISAKRMQDLQPHMVALREKYKDDQQKLSQEMFALYRKHGVNPLGGCLPALVQIPIFMSLWQALNNSVQLRQAQFLWMDNLAAPDMLFRLPDFVPELPLIGGFIGPYFNLLPLIVLGLTFFQTKLFTPPATSPEMETQQKVFKVMMFVMLFIFYRVPSGLVLYFITSSSWSIAERLLLPKVVSKPVVSEEGDEGKDGRGPGGKGGPGGPNGQNGPKGPGGWLSRKFEELMEEANKETTYRREQAVKGADRDRDRDRGRGPAQEPDRVGKSRPKRKGKPGRRR